MKLTAIFFCVLIIAGCSKAEAKGSTAGVKASSTRSLNSNKTIASRSYSKKSSYVSEKAKQVRKTKSVLSSPEYVYYPLGDCKRWVTFNFNGYRCIDRD